MKKLLSILLLSVFAVFYSYSLEIEPFEYDTEVYNKVESLLTKDFKGSELQYKNFDYINNLALELPLDVRMELYENKSRSSTGYTWLNFALPGLGSLIQGDVSGGVNSLVLYSIGATVFDIGFATYVFGLYGYMFYAVTSSLAEEDFQDFFETPVFKFAVTATFAGLGMMAGSLIYSLIRPSKYSRAYNSQLADVLGVSDADFAILPYLDSAANNGGVTLSVALKL